MVIFPTSGTNSWNAWRFVSMTLGTFGVFGLTKPEAERSTLKVSFVFDEAR
jgi:hypothetical protein